MHRFRQEQKETGAAWKQQLPQLQIYIVLSHEIPAVSVLQHKFLNGTQQPRQLCLRTSKRTEIISELLEQKFWRPNIGLVIFIIIIAMLFPVIF